MPGTDSLITFENPTLKALHIGIYDRSGKCTRNHATISVNGVQTAHFKSCRLVSVSVEVLQHGELQTESNGYTFERLITQDPGMSITP